MKAIVFSATAVLMLAMAGAAASSAHAQQYSVVAPSNTPLLFGMNAEQVSQVLGVPLNYVRGRPGNELYLALPNVKGAALSDRNDGLYLQFRRGRLSGWKGDWYANRP